MSASDTLTTPRACEGRSVTSGGNLPQEPSCQCQAQTRMPWFLCGALSAGSLPCTCMFQVQEVFTSHTTPDFHVLFCCIGLNWKDSNSLKDIHCHFRSRSRLLISDGDSLSHSQQVPAVKKMKNHWGCGMTCGVTYWPRKLMLKTGLPKSPITNSPVRLNITTDHVPHQSSESPPDICLFSLFFPLPPQQEPLSYHISAPPSVPHNVNEFQSCPELEELSSCTTEFSSPPTCPSAVDPPSLLTVFVLCHI